MTTLARNLDDLLYLSDLFGPRTQWSPSVNFGETETHYILEADLPGIPKSSVRVSCQSEMLLIEGERTLTLVSRRHRHDSREGKFQVRYQLPRDALSDGTEAQMQNGVLVLKIPRGSPGRGKEIVIS